MKNKTNQPNPSVVFAVTSGYGFNTRQPYIEIKVREARVQMSPGDARALALNLLAAAEAALGDAFLVEYVTERLGIDINTAAAILNEFRGWRHGRDVVPGSGPIQEAS